MAFDSYNVIKEKIILLSLVALLEKMLTVDAYFASKSLTSWKNSVRSAKKFFNIRFCSYMHSAIEFKCFLVKTNLKRK